MRSLLKPHGFSREEWEHGAVILKNLYTCCHCQFTWEAEVQSLGGELAGGFCGKCFGYICKNPECATCIPWEQRLENVEAGRDRLAPRLTTVSIPDLSLILGRKLR